MGQRFIVISQGLLLEIKGCKLVLLRDGATYTMKIVGISLLMVTVIQIRLNNYLILLLLRCKDLFQCFTRTGRKDEVKMYLSEKYSELLQLTECIKVGFDDCFEIEKNNGYSKTRLFSEYLLLPYDYGILSIKEVGILPEKHGVYSLSSPLNGTIYVGMSQNLSSRFHYLPDSVSPNTLVYEDGGIKVGHTQISRIINKYKLSPYTDDINIEYIAFDQIEKSDLLALEGLATYLFGLHDANAYKKFSPNSSKHKKDLQERLRRIDILGSFWLCLEGSFPVEPRFG